MNEQKQMRLFDFSLSRFFYLNEYKKIDVQPIYRFTTCQKENERLLH